MKKKNGICILLLASFLLLPELLFLNVKTAQENKEE